jgi:large subunit ribosomal protein L19e
MKLNTQKKLAAQILKCSQKRIRLDPSRLEDIKESITKADIRRLIIDKAIKAAPVQGPSRVRARKLQNQKKKGRRRGLGSRKGTKGARMPKKEIWMKRIRVQRELIKKLYEKKLIKTDTYHDLYAKSKGGFFRSLRHIKLYIEEHRLIKK